MRLHMQARSVECCSNDPKYKGKKVVHRKKQQQARHCLQASSRQAVQESATATAIARPLLNLSTMAATSMVSSQPSRTCSQPGIPSVAKIIHSVVAQLWAFNLVSATQCGAVVRCVTFTGFLPINFLAKVSQASILTMLLFAPYPQPLSGPQTRSKKKKSLVECPKNVHENTIKTHEFSGVYFNLKGRSWPVPIKLSLALSAEGSHRAALCIIIVAALGVSGRCSVFGYLYIYIKFLNTLIFY